MTDDKVSEDIFSEKDIAIAETLKWRIWREMSEDSPDFALIDRLLDAWRLLLGLPFETNSD